MVRLELGRGARTLTFALRQEGDRGRIKNMSVCLGSLLAHACRAEKVSSTFLQRKDVATSSASGPSHPCPRSAPAGLF